MAIDRFTLARFEAALPKKKPNGDNPAEPLARSIGLVQGEYCFIIQPFENMPVGLFIRSSVDSTGIAADTGEDSIRVLWCELAADGSYKIIGNKAKAYTTRVKGWEDRLIVLLRKLAAVVKWCQPCPKCGKRLTPFTTKNGDNAGRCFVSCSHCKNGDKSSVFFWTEDEDEKPLTFSPELFRSCKPVSALVTCPKCGKQAADVSQFPQNGSHHCYARNGGCRHSFTPSTPKSPAETPIPRKPTETPPAKTNATSATPDAKNDEPGRYSGPITLAALVELVEEFRDVLHDAADPEALTGAVRSSNEAARLSSFIQRFHFVHFKP